MNHYTITRIHGQPDWNSIPWLSVENHQWTEPTDIRMKVQICYNEAGFHLHMRAWEKEVRAVFNEPLCDVCRDSCMEFFFRPVADDIRYFNIEMNPNACSYIGFGSSTADLIRLVIQNEDTIMQKRVNYTEDGWELYYTVPVEVIRVFFPGYQLESGMQIRANCYKCGDDTSVPHFITWNYVDYPTPSFHQPSHYGLMTLE